MVKTQTIPVPAVGFIFLMIVAAMWLAMPVPREMPALDQVILCEHAVERHGDDALEARKRLFDCKPVNLRAKLCPPGSKYGLSVVFWCEPPGATICAGMYVTIGGVEKTAFLRPCEQWRNCQ